MLSAFPALLSYQQTSPLIIRLVLAIILIHWSYRGLRTSDQTRADKVLALAEGLIGLLLLVGLWTQVAALIAAVGLLVCLIRKIRVKAFLTDGVNYALILLVLAISLLVTGPGWIAFDYPL